MVKNQNLLPVLRKNSKPKTPRQKHDLLDTRSKGENLLTTIDLVPRNKLAEMPKMPELLALADEFQAPDARFLQLLAHAPNYAQANFKAMHVAHFEGGVDHNLKEIVRIQLARKAKDTYSAKLRSRKALRAGLTEDLIDAGCTDSFEQDDRFSPAEKWALRYAYLMYRDRRRVGTKEFYDDGKKYWSEAQIMEIGAHIAIQYGFNMFLRTLKMSDNAESS